MFCNVVHLTMFKMTTSFATMRHFRQIVTVQFQSFTSNSLLLAVSLYHHHVLTIPCGCLQIQRHLFDKYIGNHAWYQLCRHLWYRRLSLWQPTVSELVPWQFSVHASCNFKLNEQYEHSIDQFHKSHIALVPYSTMHFGKEMCTFSVLKWCGVGYGNGA